MSDLTGQTEVAELENIRTLLIRPESRLSHVLNLHRMKHQQSVSAFSASIRIVISRYSAHALGHVHVQANILAKPDQTLAEAETYQFDQKIDYSNHEESSRGTIKGHF